MGNITSSLCEICARKIGMNKKNENENVNKSKSKSKNKNENTEEFMVETNDEDLYLLTTAQNGVPNFIYHEWYKEL